MVVEKACTVCETPFSKEVGPNRSRTKYCSRKCHDTAKRMSRYGINFQEFLKLIEDQNGICLLCRVPFVELEPKHIHIDHCHRSGKIRGILCSNCNQGLGQFKENVEALNAAVKYLSS